VYAPPGMGFWEAPGGSRSGRADGPGGAKAPARTTGVGAAYQGVCSFSSGVAFGVGGCTLEWGLRHGASAHLSLLPEVTETWSFPPTIAVCFCPLAVGWPLSLRGPSTAAGLATLLAEVSGAGFHSSSQLDQSTLLLSDCLGCLSSLPSFFRR
jgi:hypothetical protein